jgi:hypothetical protein
LNISIVSHGFHGGAKAMSKTARGYRSQLGCESKKHPAILPWPSGLSRDIDGPLPVVKPAELYSAGQMAKASLRFRRHARGKARAQT